MFQEGRVDPTVQNHWNTQARLCETHEKNVDSFKGSKSWRPPFGYYFKHLDLQRTVLLYCCLGAVNSLDLRPASTTWRDSDSYFIYWLSFFSQLLPLRSFQDNKICIGNQYAGMEGESVQHEVNILITSCVLTSGFSMPVQVASAGQDDSGALIHEVQSRGGDSVTVALLPMHKSTITSVSIPITDFLAIMEHRKN